MFSLKVFILLIVLSVASTDFSNLRISTYDGVTDNLNPEFDSLSYIKLGKNYYYFGFETKSWLGAAIYCREINSHLATIANEDEWQVLHDYLNEKLDRGGNYNWWISYTDQEKEGAFVSIADGSTLNSSKWVEGEPNNWDGNEHCLGLRQIRSFLINDFPCNYNYNFICQISRPKTVTFTVW